MTFLAAGGINDHNMQRLFSRYTDILFMRLYICYIYLHVHESAVYLYSSSFTVYRKPLKKLWNDEDWRTMPNPYPLVSTEPPRLQDLFFRSETIELLLSSNFSTAESYVDLLTNLASIEDVWHLLFLEMRWGLLYNEKGSSLSYWSYLGIIDIRTMACNGHPGCYWSSKSCRNATGSSNGGIVTCVDIITWCSAPNYPKFHTGQTRIFPEMWAASSVGIFPDLAAPPSTLKPSGKWDSGQLWQVGCPRISKLAGSAVACVGRPHRTLTIWTLPAQIPALNKEIQYKHLRTSASAPPPPVSTKKTSPDVPKARNKCWLWEVLSVWKQTRA